jgi:hypothetical protein
VRLPADGCSRARYGQTQRTSRSDRSSDGTGSKVRVAAMKKEAGADVPIATGTKKKCETTMAFARAFGKQGHHNAALAAAVSSPPAIAFPMQPATRRTVRLCIRLSRRVNGDGATACRACAPAPSGPLRRRRPVQLGAFLPDHARLTARQADYTPNTPEHHLKVQSGCTPFLFSSAPMVNPDRSAIRSRFQCLKSLYCERTRSAAFPCGDAQLALSIAWQGRVNHIANP